VIPVEARQLSAKRITLEGQTDKTDSGAVGIDP
jgi:hypothetical protein